MQYETIYTGRESYDKNSYMDKPVKALETAVHNNQPFNQNIYDSVPQNRQSKFIHVEGGHGDVREFGKEKIINWLKAL